MPADKFHFDGATAFFLEDFRALCAEKSMAVQGTRDELLFAPCS